VTGEPPVGADTTSTPASQSFLANVYQVNGFSATIARGMPHLPQSTDGWLSLPAGEAAAAVEAFQSASDGLVVAIRLYLVFLVTVTETYLQDVLAYVEQRHPLHVANSGKQLEYKELFKPRSLESLRADLCEEWAAAFVDHGGPDTWIKKLTTWGARYGRAHLADEMEELWAIRNCIVHRAGTVDAKLASQFPNRGAIGGPVSTPHTELQSWGDVVMSFVSGTETHVLARIKAHGAKES
jgi:hypothetical protein